MTGAIKGGRRSVAIVQLPPAVLQLSESIDRAVAAIEQASGADLIVFPETWLTGYPAWVFGMAGWGDPEAKKWYGRLLRESPVLGSQDDLNDSIGAIREAARRVSATVVLGLNERSRSGGTLYNSIATIDTEGRLVNVHRKLVPTHTERVVWGAGDGAGLQVLDTPAGRIGALVCWEHWMPLARQALHEQGEQIHVGLWPDMPEIHEIAARSYAREAGCFVISAALFLTASDLPPELVEPYRAGLGPEATGDILFDGGSSIAAPDGSWQTEPLRGRAELIVAEIDLVQVDEAHTDLDVAGHYSRPDVLRLQLNRNRHDSLEEFDDNR